MKPLVFGSLNIDHTYHLPHLVKEGEMLTSTAYTKNGNGKGFNKAVTWPKQNQTVPLPAHSKCFAKKPN